MAGSSQTRFPCPECGELHTKVRSTSPSIAGINRRRLCKNGHSFKTIEVCEEDFDKIHQAAAEMWRGRQPIRG